MFAPSVAVVIPRTRQKVGAQTTMITASFTTKKFIVFNVLPRDGIFNQPYFFDHIFPDLKTANLNHQLQKTGPTFWVHMDNSVCQNGWKVTSKIKKKHISRMLHTSYSPDISPCDFWLFGM
jgi:hypothetical protein